MIGVANSRRAKNRPRNAYVPMQPAPLNWRRGSRARARTAVHGCCGCEMILPLAELPATAASDRSYSFWWTAGGSNPRPLHCERSALPAELAAHPRVLPFLFYKIRRHASHASRKKFFPAQPTQITGTKPIPPPGRRSPPTPPPIILWLATGCGSQSSARQVVASRRTPGRKKKGSSQE